MRKLLLAPGHLCECLCLSVENLGTYSSDSQDPPSSPSPLLEALKAFGANPDTLPVPNLPGEVVSDLASPVGLPLLYDLKHKSKTFPPSSINKNANLFLQMVTNEITALSTQSEIQNLSSSHKAALSQLKALEDVVIKEADKGGCVVVLRTTIN